MGYGNGEAGNIGSIGGIGYAVPTASLQNAMKSPGGQVQQVLAEHEHELAELASAIVELEKRLCAVLTPVPPEPALAAPNSPNAISSPFVSGKVAEHSRAVRMLQSRVGSMLQRLEL